ncbi:hypothetical protein LQ757_04890 [Agromyces sp. SYSU K20354]|uniref:hypothetical protein n=1 Tax=Agromyces cavernae TaxID=2898659 RepID=UPI001E57ADC5|nr:hypothetical protein [Agromyces cavernae]MCD2441608.1 hypothetical protein [Agromyces cavernae]
MADGLWWLPSLLVFGAAAVVLGGAVVGLRRLGMRRERRDLEQGRAAEVAAKARIVQADDAVRDAEREVSFVEAQFGAASARELRATVDSARAWLREAFLLQQRLDDAEPDSAAERRTWTARIDDLCRSALAAIDEADAALAARRRAERGAGAELPALREEAARLERRRAEASQALDRLATRFDASALAGARSAASRAQAALAGAAEALDEADRRVDGNRPAADRLGVAGDQMARAARELGELEGFELELAAAQASANEEAAALGGELAAARQERDGAAAADAGARLGEAIGEVSAVVAARGEVAGDPFVDRDRLRAARDRLEVARAAARTAQNRLDGARGALGGAIAIAESQVRIARAAIDRGRGGVGADARTRLAEAERQLVIARQEPDPVAALDAARRATSRASDAEALAMFDVRGG